MNFSPVKQPGTKGKARRVFALILLVTLCLPKLCAQIPTLRSVAEIRAIPFQDLDRGYECEFEGVVIGVVERTDRVLVQDGDEGVVVQPPYARRQVPPVGARIKVRGVTTRNSVIRVQARSWEILDREVGRPDILKLDIPAAFTAPANGRLVELAGLIQTITTNRPPAPSILRNRLSLHLRQDTNVISVVAPIPPRRIGERLKLAKIRIRGVLHDVLRRNQPPVRVLWNTSWDDADIIEPGYRNPFVQRVTPLHALPDAPPDLPVRVRGRVLEDMVDGRYPIGILPSPGQPRVLAWQRAGPPVKPGDTVDLLGFNRPMGDASQMEVVELQWLGLPRDFDRREEAFPALSNYVAAARSVSAIRKLSPGQVASGWPVRIYGIVNHHDREKPEFYLQRDAGGVLVRWKGTNEIPAIGQPIRVYGHVTGGVRQPEVEGTMLELMTLRSPFEPRPISVSSFMAGAFTGGRLKMQGIVRSAQADTETNTVELRIDWDGAFVRARLNLRGEEMPDNWVDARVEVTGIAHPEMVPRNSYPEEIILISEAKDLKIVEPPPTDPFAGKLWPISDVLRRAWREPGVRRLRITGVITATQPIHILDDGTGGIQIRQREGLDLRFGDEVEAIGFPRWSRSAPRLSEVLVRKIGPGKLPPASPTNARQVTMSDCNGRRVILQGRVTGHSGETLDLRADGIAFSAVVPGVEGHPWPEGATVEVTGVCQFSSGGSGIDPGFRVLLPGSEAVTMVGHPTKWTNERVTTIAAGAMVLIVAALGWALFFRFRARQSQSQLLTTFHANPMPGWIIRRDDLRCIEVNAEFEKVFSLTREELLGKRMRDFQLWDNDSARQEFLESVARQPSQRAVEARLRGKDGQTFDMLLSAEPVRVEGAECVLLIANDLTERLKLLEQLRQAQKMEAVGQLAAGVAHDFNNLLTVVCGNSGLIQLKPGLDEETAVLTREIEDAGGRAADLTGKLLAYSRKSVMQRRHFDLNDTIQSVAGMLNRMVGEIIDVGYKTNDQPLPVHADATMIDQVLLNLGVNSRDAMPDGGRLSIQATKTEFTPKKPPMNPDGKPGHYAVVTVSDTGCGMPPDVLEHVFDPFFTTKEVGKGTGLGLSTAYGILRQHEGWIDAESRPGKGTTFTFYLPLANNLPAADKPESIDQSSACGHETILVVEDEETVRQTVNRVLSEYGYQVLLAEDGPAAESIWKESASTVDLVLTDLVMPNGLSGFDLAGRLLDERKDLKVIYMTGHSQELIEHGGRLKPGVDFLPKPFENAELVRMIRNRLDEQTAIRN